MVTLVRALDIPQRLPNQIGGTDRHASAGETFDKLNPDDGSAICQVARSRAADIERPSMPRAPRSRPGRP